MSRIYHIYTGRDNKANEKERTSIATLELARVLRSSNPRLRITNGNGVYKARGGLDAKRPVRDRAVRRGRQLGRHAGADRGCRLRRVDRSGEGRHREIGPEEAIR